jgi:regulator of protease activity HflC (stomatin/prohibitin superfamily)
MIILLHEILKAGFICLLAPIDEVVGRISLRVQEMKVSLETKTQDNVFVNVHVSIQYQAIRDKIYSAFYVLSDLEPQMKAYVFDVVRAALCTMTLDHAFESKDEISIQLKDHLQEVMTTYGYSILNALIMDLVPDAKVREGKYRLALLVT